MHALRESRAVVLSRLEPVFPFKFNLTLGKAFVTALEHVKYMYLYTCRQKYIKRPRDR